MFIVNKRENIQRHQEECRDKRNGSGLDVARVICERGEKRQEEQEQQQGKGKPLPSYRELKGLWEEGHL